VPLHLIYHTLPLISVGIKLAIGSEPTGEKFDKFGFQYLPNIIAEMIGKLTNEFLKKLVVLLFRFENVYSLAWLITSTLLLR